MNLENLAFLPPSIGFMPSFAQAVSEGYQLRTSGPDFTAEEIDEIQNRPKDFLDRILNPAKEFLLPNGKTVQRVDGITLWVVQANNFIGNLNIRFHLNEILERNGGHIGYSVHSKYRQQGIATKMLKYGLAFCATELKLDTALLTCEETNLASARVIEKCNGKLQDIIPSSFFENIKIKRYLVPTMK